MYSFSFACWGLCWSALLAGLCGFPCFIMFSLSCRLFGSLVSRPGPGGHTLSHFSPPVRLARLKCLCLPPCVVVVVVPGGRFPAAWYVSSRASDATQCAVFISLGNSSRLMGAVWCVCVRVRSRLPCLGITFGSLVFWLALSEFGRGGCRRRLHCLRLVAACFCYCSCVGQFATILCVLRI